MRKAVLFTAVVVAAAVGALLWYVGAKAAEPEHNKDVAIGTYIDWTIPEDPDCNNSVPTLPILLSGHHTDRCRRGRRRLGQHQDIRKQKHGLIVTGNRVHGTIARGDGYSDRHPLYIYVDVISEVSESRAIVCRIGAGGRLM